MRVGKGRSYSHGNEKYAKDATRGQLALGWWGEDECAYKGRRVRANVWAATMDGMHAPLSVTINNPWRHSADIRSAANKQENGEEGSEAEQRELRSEITKSGDGGRTPRR